MAPLEPYLVQIMQERFGQPECKEMARDWLSDRRLYLVDDSGVQE